MTLLFVPIHGHYDGGEETAYGESLDTAAWDGAEVGLLDGLPSLLAAVAAAEAKDWLLGVHWPVVRAPGQPVHLPLLHPDPEERRRALQAAAGAMDQARQVGARYILFHFPVPAVQPAGADLAGWRHSPPPVAPWPGAAGAARAACAGLAEASARTGVEVVLEVDGPHPEFYTGDLWERLLDEFPALTLCVDTGRLERIARAHGLDGAALARRLLPRCRHLHLYECRRDAGESRVPALPGHTRAGGWIGAAALAADWAPAAGRRARLVPEHDPRKLPPASLAAHRQWLQSLRNPARDPEHPDGGEEDGGGTHPD